MPRVFSNPDSVHFDPDFPRLYLAAGAQARKRGNGSQSGCCGGTNSFGVAVGRGYLVQVIGMRRLSVKVAISPANPLSATVACIVVDRLMAPGPG
jgi:hypothetical protein